MSRAAEAQALSDDVKKAAIRTMIAILTIEDQSVDAFFPASWGANHRALTGFENLQELLKKFFYAGECPMTKDICAILSAKAKNGDPTTFTRGKSGSGIVFYRVRGSNDGDVQKFAHALENRNPGGPGQGKCSAYYKQRRFRDPTNSEEMGAVDGLISGLPGAMLKGCTKTNVKALIMSELQKIKIEPTPPPTATVSAGQSSATAILLADDAETPPHGPKIPIDPSNGPGVKTMTIASNALDINSESCQIMIAMASMLKEKCPDEHTRLSSTRSADLSARSKRVKTMLFAAAALKSTERIKGNKQ